MNATRWVRGASALLILLVLGCGGAKASHVAPRSYGHSAAVAPAQPPPVPASPGGAPATPQAAAATPTTGPAKAAVKSLSTVAQASAHVIYTGGVTMLEESEKMPALIDAIIDLAEAQGGRIQSRRDDGVSIRVPSTVFRETMTKIDRLGVVTQRLVAAEDVSEEMHDAEVRLMNLQATRKRLQELFAKANDIPTTLTIERELERVSQEIDRVEGRLRFLQARASMSTIDVRIAAKPKAAIVAATPDPVPAPPPKRHGIRLPITWLDKVDAAHLSSF
jgi:hypothetical protein